jgi:hypothetical protein
MSEYYLVKNPDAADFRKVHRDNCNTLPNAPAFDASLKYLGSYGNKEAAYSMARSFFDSIEYCESCCKP